MKEICSEIKGFPINLSILGAMCQFYKWVGICAAPPWHGMIKGFYGIHKMGEFYIVERGNHNAIHGIFDSEERAQRHLWGVIPGYCKRGYFMDKTLTPEDFEILSRL